MDWPEDVASLADHLGISRFYVLGWSAGGSHALACAYKMPDRVISGAIVSGLAPPDRPKPFKGYKGFLLLLMVLGRRFPKLVYPFRRMTAKQINSAFEKMGDRFVKSLPDVDQKPFADQNVPVNQGYYQADLLPNSNFHLMKNRGHMFLLEEWKNVLSELIKSTE